MDIEREIESQPSQRSPRLQRPPDADQNCSSRRHRVSRRSSDTTATTIAMASRHSSCCRRLATKPAHPSGSRERRFSDGKSAISSWHDGWRSEVSCRLNHFHQGMSPADSTVVPTIRSPWQPGNNAMNGITECPICQNRRHGTGHDQVPRISLFPSRVFPARLR